MPSNAPAATNLPFGYVGNKYNPLASQESNALATNYGGTADSWFHAHKHEIKDPTRLLLMRMRRQAPFWHMLLSKFPKLPVTSVRFMWDEEEYVNTSWTPTATEASDVTKITVGTSAVKEIQPGNLLSVEGIYTIRGAQPNNYIYYAASKVSGTLDGATVNLHLPETVKVVSRDLVNGVIYVERGFGGAAAPANIGSLLKTAPYIGTTHKLYYAGDISPEISGARSGFRRNPSRIEQMCQQMMSDSWYTTIIEKNTNFLSIRPINKSKRDSTLKFLKGIDRSMLHAGRMGVSTVVGADGGTSMQTSMTSLVEQIPNANWLNFGGIVTTKSLNNALKPVWDIGSSVKYGFTTRSVMYELYYAYEQKIPVSKDTFLNYGITSYEIVTPDGKTLILTEDPEMENFTTYANAIIICDMGENVGMDSTLTDPYLQYVHLQNCDVQVLPITPNSQRVTVQNEEMLYAVLGVRVAFASSHFVLYNILSR